MSPRIVFLLLLAVLLLMSWQTGKRVSAYLAVKREVTLAQEEVAKLKTKNEELQGILQYVQGDAFLEREARLKFGLGLRGEKQVVVVPDKDTSVPPPQEQPISHARRWWEYFFGRD